MGFRSNSAGWLLLGCLLNEGMIRAQNASLPVPLPEDGLQRAVATGRIYSSGNAEILSETYWGMLASPECAGVRVELYVYQEGMGQGSGSVKPAVYHMRETCIDTTGPLKVVESNGTWREVLDQKKWQAILILQDAHTSEEKRFARVEDNGGTLLRLDVQMQEQPPNVPHALGRVTGERQGHMLLLSDADDGRTIELKAGEVLFLRLTRKPGREYSEYSWTSNRPDSMVLLESVGETLGDTVPTPAQLAAAVAATQFGAPAEAGSTSAQRTKAAGSLRQTMRNASDGQYQVWQLVAPQKGQQDLRFELRRPTTIYERPKKVFTLSVVVP
jgi:predicted secreted protein